jgi:hypothetical protein
MADYQTISIVLTGIGMIIALTYYGLQIRNQNKTRQAQLFMEVYRDFKSKEVQSDWWYAMNAEWEDYDDYNRKYLSPENIEEGMRIGNFGAICEGLGVLVHRKLVDVKLVDELMRSYVISYWEKMAPLAPDIRKGMPLFLEWTEYLYNEIVKIESKPAYLLNE